MASTCNYKPIDLKLSHWQIALLLRWLDTFWFHDLISFHDSYRLSLQPKAPYFGFNADLWISRSNYLQRHENWNQVSEGSSEREEMECNICLLQKYHTLELFENNCNEINFKYIIYYEKDRNVVGNWIIQHSEDSVIINYGSGRSLIPSLVLLTGFG